MATRIDSGVPFLINTDNKIVGYVANDSRELDMGGIPIPPGTSPDPGAFLTDLIRTWDNGATTFTAFKLNVTDTASAAGSLLMDFQIGGVSKEKTDKNGNKTLAGTLLLSAGSFTSPGLNLGSSNAGIFSISDDFVGVTDGSATQAVFGPYGSSIGISALNGIGFSTDPRTVSADLILTRDGPSILAQRNGTAAQAFRLYNTFTDSSNYERVVLEWISNDLVFGTTQAGTGTARKIQFRTGGSARWNMETNGDLVGVTATGGVGYGTGAGGTVTQATNKSTGVILNTVTGEITMDAAALAANTTVSFMLTNSAIAATDLVLITHDSAGTAGAYTVTAQGAAGSANIAVRNVTAGSLSEAIVLKFAVFKAVNS